jgi:hypothetical protein
MSTESAVLVAANPFETDLDRTPANHQPLTPLGFIARAALIYPDRPAVVHGSRRYTWRETYPGGSPRRWFAPGSAVAIPSR